MHATKDNYRLCEATLKTIILCQGLLIYIIFIFSVENKCIFKYIQGSTSSVKAISPIIYIFNPYAAVSNKENFLFEIIYENKHDWL